MLTVVVVASAVTIFAICSAVIQAAIIHVSVWLSLSADLLLLAAVLILSGAGYLTYKLVKGNTK